MITYRFSPGLLSMKVVFIALGAMMSIKAVSADLGRQAAMIISYVQVQSRVLSIKAVLTDLGTMISYVQVQSGVLSIKAVRNDDPYRFSWGC